MVRLKVNQSDEITPIKLRISIPYGSIKSNMKPMQLINISQFQFLMVRLKVIRWLRKDELLKVISIPYGSIKRGVRQCVGVRQC